MRVDCTSRKGKALNSFDGRSYTASLKGSGVEQLQLFITAMPRERGDLTYLSMTTAGVWLAMLAIEGVACPSI